MNKTYSGIFTALATPYNQNGSINERVLRTVQKFVRYR